MNAQKNKGDRAEREACIYLTAATGHIIERRFGAGQNKDKGDLINAYEYIHTKLNRKLNV